MCERHHIITTSFKDICTKIYVRKQHNTKQNLTKMSMPRRLSVKTSTFSMQTQHLSTGEHVIECYKTYNELILLNVVFTPGTTIFIFYEIDKL